jgi:hypothetical protein
MKNIEFEYDLKQKIKINNINTQGFIIGYYYGESGIQYQVAYFISGERKTAYLYPEEINASDGKEDLGFLK